MIDYLINYPDKIIQPFIEHIELVLVTLVISLICASVLTVIAYYNKRIGQFLLHLFSIVYSIPSLALFALLIPVAGLGVISAIIALVMYNQYLLLRNFLTGLNEVDVFLQEAAFGIGMKKFEILYLILLPLSKKAIFAGIRLALISTIGIGTIAASINAGGLGTLLFDGLRTMNMIKIIWGSLLSGILALLSYALLRQIEKGVKVHG